MLEPRPSAAGWRLNFIHLSAHFTVYKGDKVARLFGCFSIVAVMSAAIACVGESNVVAQPLVLSVDEASQKGLIEFSINGTGGSSGDVVAVTVRRTVQQSMRLALTPGTVLRSTSSNVQRMIVASVKGELLGGDTYRQTDVIELRDDKERTYVIEAYCLDFEKDNPGASDRFTIATVDGAAMSLIQAIPSGSRSVAVVQAALWLAAGVTKASIKERFDVSERELLVAEKAVTAAKH